MKMIIICGSLEPGKDGVGDYSRRLAGQMVKWGHKTQLLALNDKVVIGAEESEQMIDGISLKCLRMGTGLETKLKIEYSKKWVHAFQPDILSLQYVPFAFHPKGIHIGLDNLLGEIGNGKPWHFMFHELWVGLPKAGSMKIKLWGSVQKFIISNLIKKLKPVAISTTIPLYQQKLKEHQALLLPLFGNIPKVCDDLTDRNSNKNFQIVHFGSVSGFQDDFRNQLTWVKQFCDSGKRSAKIVFAGAMGGNKDSAVKISKELLGINQVEIKGWLTEEQLSALFASSQLGISRADTIFYGKSGSTIAMLEHGLPILLRDLNILQIHADAGEMQTTLIKPGQHFELAKTNGENRLVTTAASLLKVLSEKIKLA